MSSSDHQEGESFFSTITNEILDAAEKITNRLEEGFALIFDASSSAADHGTSGSSGGSAAPRQTLTREQMEATLHGEFSNEELQMLEDEDMDGMPASPLDGMAESVLGDIMANQAGPQNPLEHFHAFRHAISWYEPFILWLIAFQIFIFCSAIYVSRKERGLTLRLIVMITIAAIVRGAESINQWASRNWAQFATQNYFDKRGIFVSVMICAPLLLDSLIMLLLFLREASQLLIQVKTAQLKKQRKQSQNQSNKSTGGATSKRPKKAKKED